MHELLTSPRYRRGRLLRGLRRVGLADRRLPGPLRPVLVAEVMDLTLQRADAMAAARRVVPGLDSQLQPFADFWSSEVVPVMTRAHESGIYAGSGPVDFLEALVVYTLIREQRPKRVLELGLAAGISGWIWGTALEENGDGGTLDTVDIVPRPAAVEPFQKLVARGVVRPHVQDGVDFVRATDEKYDVTFSDALHTYEFNKQLAQALARKFPSATHCYHEWSLAPHASRPDAKYVSMQVNLGSCGERQAFEQAFPHHEHLGVPSSCGLGVVRPGATARHDLRRGAPPQPRRRGEGAVPS